jgi:hypothetical protein
MKKCRLEACYRKMTSIAEMCKSLSGLNFMEKFKWSKFPKSMKMPFWGFDIMTKKIVSFFLSQNVCIKITLQCLFFLNCG